ncbi:MAG: copper resistance CopC family protein [Acidobacteriota bacterium]|nr:copper resistance CopC family protein [Acidobacteriota bacterium]
MKRRTLILLICAVAVFASAAMAHILVKDVSPSDGGALSAPPRDLRVWFNRPPDVSKSELGLTGPAGALEIDGLHSMGENDLMARIVGRLPDGEYTASWKAAGDDGHERKGTWAFTLKRGSGD